jgi:dUTP pyrophosphatase
MKVKIKKLAEHAPLPTYATEGAAALDIKAIDYRYDSDYGFHEYGTGLSIEIPKGYVGLLFPRSSITKTAFTLGNCVGVIDSDYRGELLFRFREVKELNFYEVGDKIGQLMIVPYPKIELEEVENLTETERGEGGFGSTG